MLNGVIRRTIIKRITGNLTALSFREGEELSEETIPFDAYIQIIDGSADVTIIGKSIHLNLESGMIIPAHTMHRFKANQKFKLISTMIRSGYGN